METGPPTVESQSQRRSLRLGLALLALATVLTATAYRTVTKYQHITGEFDWSSRGMSDFHNGLYLPTRAFLNRDNPWSLETAERYGMARAAPAYSPALFVVNAPFALLPLPQADIAFFVFNALLVLALPLLGVAFGKGKPAATWLVVAVLACAVASRPGHITLFTGYFTAELAVGVAMALHFARSKPWVAGVGIAIASFKPNFVLPLLVLMMCRRDWRAVAWGLAVAAALALAGLLWLASSSSLGEIIDGYREGQQALYDDQTELPENRWTRVDLVGLVARWFGGKPSDGFYLAAMPILLIVPGWILFRATSPDVLVVDRTELAEGATGVSGMVIALAMLLSIHHHAYDCLILLVPITALLLQWPELTGSGSRTREPGLSRSALVAAGLALVPFWNYASTITFQERFGLDRQGLLWHVITAANGVCLLIALAVMLVGLARYSRDSSRPTG